MIKIIGLIFLLTFASGFGAGSEEYLGVVVEEVQPGGAGAAAGLEPGDVLFSWSRETADAEEIDKHGGAFQSPLDLWAVEVEQVPRGATRFEGKKRDGKPLSAELRPLRLDITVRPNLPDAALDIYQQGRDLIAEGQWSEGVALWNTILEAPSEQPPAAPVKLWLFEEMAETFANERQWEMFDQIFDQALADVQSGDSLPKARLLERRGELNQKAKRYELARISIDEALGISKRLFGDSLTTAGLLYRRGELSRVPGDYNDALSFFQESSRISGLHAPVSTSHVDHLNKLGLLYCNIGDYFSAADYLEQANQISLVHAPDSTALGINLLYSGYLALERSSLVKARHYLDAAVTTFDRVDKERTYHPWVLNLQGYLAFQQGEVDKAEALFHQALDLFNEKGAEGFGHAFAHGKLALCARQKKDYPRAAALLEMALASFEKLAPDNLLTSRLRYELGGVYRTMGRQDRSLQLFEEAFRAIEANVDDLSDVAETTRANYSARYRKYYRDNIDLLVTMGLPERAFQILESYHGRVFLKQMTDRENARSQKSNGQLIRQRGALHRELEEIQATLSHAESIDNLKYHEDQWSKMTQLLGERAQLLNQSKRDSPHQINYPEPLDYEAAQATLESGTALISYMVHDQRSLVFIVRANRPCKVFQVPISSDQLNQKIQDFRLFITKPGSDRARNMMFAAGKELYQLLIEPFETELQTVERLLIVPDGPLWTLPFSALVTSAGSSPRYLIEEYPITLANSATAYGRLQEKEDNKTRAGATSPRFVAFGAPHFVTLNERPNTQSLSLLGSAPLWDDASQEMQQEESFGFAYEPLAFSKPEVEELVEKYYPQGRVYVGREATEANAKALDETVDVIHFSCHGILDENYPQNSALVLRKGNGNGADNGLLQAWEISELKLDAALVVLSSCASGLGHPLDGEGVLGLTRAFQYAGGRSVVNSLWRVSDLSTYLLMKTFYLQLASGFNKDEALRLAQLNLLRSEQEKVNHPFYWAAFQLHGNWSPVARPAKGAVPSGRMFSSP